MSRPSTWPEALAQLAKPVPQKFIKQKPDASRADYVPHHIIRQYLHGLFDDHWFETLEVVKKDDTNYALQVRLHIRLGDEWRQYDGWGESDNRKNPIKSAESDAVKRIVAMHLGLGLHLWSREHYFLPDALAKNLEEAAEEASQKDAEYGGDGDEDPELAAGESPAPVASRGVEAPPSSAPHSSSPEVEEGEALASGEPNDEDIVDAEIVDDGPAERGDPSERASLNATFHGIIQGAGLKYDEHVRPFLEHHYGTSLSGLPIDKFRQLVGKLNDGSQAEKQDARKRFKVAVLEHAEAQS